MLELELLRDEEELLEEDELLRLLLELENEVLEIELAVSSRSRMILKNSPFR